MLGTFNSRFNSFDVDGVTFNVPKRYTDLQPLVSGLIGVWCRAKDTVSCWPAIIRKVSRPFASEDETREILMHLKINSLRHPNLASLTDVFTPQKTVHDFQDLYLVFRYDYARTIKDYLKDYATDPDRYFGVSRSIYRILSCTGYLHRHGIVHENLSMANFSSSNLVYLNIDLSRPSLAKQFAEQHVELNQYASPEVLLGMQVGPQADIWSIGCILAELLTSEVLFSGSSLKDQLNNITRLLGTPSEDFILRLQPPARDLVKSLPHSDGVPFDQQFSDGKMRPANSALPYVTPDTARDLLTRMLVIDPEKRITVDEALQHPYIKAWLRDGDLVEYPPVSMLRDSFDYICNKSPEERKQLIYREILRVKREQRTNAHWYDIRDKSSFSVSSPCMEAFDFRRKRFLAIKKLYRPYLNQAATKRAIKELKILRSLKHENIISVLDFFITDKTLGIYQDINLVVDSCGTVGKIGGNSLYLIQDIGPKRFHVAFSRLIYQLLCGIRHLHSAGIVHGDLAQSSIAFDFNTFKLKIMDFGLGGGAISHADRMKHNPRIGYHRSPEMILGMPVGPKTDVWNIGCIAIELLTDGYICRKLDDTATWDDITYCIGSPDQDFIDSLSPTAREFVMSRPINRDISLQQIEYAKHPDHEVLKELSDSNALDLISKLLVIDQDYRISLENALKHKYVRLWYKKEHMHQPVSVYDDSWEREDISHEHCKQLLSEEVERLQEEIVLREASALRRSRRVNPVEPVVSTQSPTAQNEPLKSRYRTKGDRDTAKWPLRLRTLTELRPNNTPAKRQKQSKTNSRKVSFTMRCSE